jgi:hypothetical protein
MLHYHVRLSPDRTTSDRTFEGKAEDCPHCTTTHISKEWATTFIVSQDLNTDGYRWYFEDDMSEPFATREEAVADFERWQNEPYKED